MQLIAVDTSSASSADSWASQSARTLQTVPLSVHGRDLGVVDEASVQTSIKRDSRGDDAKAVQIKTKCTTARGAADAGNRVTVGKPLLVDDATFSLSYFCL